MVIDPRQAAALGQALGQPMPSAAMPAQAVGMPGGPGAQGTAPTADQQQMVRNAMAAKAAQMPPPQAPIAGMSMQGAVPMPQPGMERGGMERPEMRVPGAVPNPMAGARRPEMGRNAGELGQPWGLRFGGQQRR